MTMKWAFSLVHICFFLQYLHRTWAMTVIEQHNQKSRVDNLKTTIVLKKKFVNHLFVPKSITKNCQQAQSKALPLPFINSAYLYNACRDYPARGMQRYYSAPGHTDLLPFRMTKVLWIGKDPHTACFNVYSGPPLFQRRTWSWWQLILIHQQFYILENPFWRIKSKYCGQKDRGMKWTHKTPAGKVGEAWQGNDGN